MSHEGVMFVSRAALVIVLIVAAAFVRALVGSDTRRNLIVGVGTLGGMAFGVAVASLVSGWIHIDLSAVFASFGILIGCLVAWLIARQFARSTN
jgi:hypothetical protein